MNVLILNGSPRPGGSTAKLVAAFQKGAESAGHAVHRVDVCRKKIAGCLACEYCHTKGNGACVQKDDMQEVYPLLQEADMLMLASPVYYHNFTGQLQCAINRFYAIGSPKVLTRLKKAALILSSGDENVYGGAMYEYENSFLVYLHLENMGVFTFHGEDQIADEALEKVFSFGAGLKD